MPYKDPVRDKEYRKQYYAMRRRTDPEFRKAALGWSRKWRRGHPEIVKRMQHKANEKARLSMKARAGYLLSRAKLRDNTCSLTRDWVLERIQCGCALTGLSFDLTARRHPLSPSIDRIDVKLGYSPSNCRVIALALNVGLSDWGISAVADIWRKALERIDGNA